jgi:hypothetical protein
MTTQKIKDQLKRISSHAKRQSCVKDTQDIDLDIINHMIDRLEQIKREVEEANQDENYPAYLEYNAELRANNHSCILNFEMWKEYNEEKSRIFDKLVAAR